MEQKNAITAQNEPKRNPIETFVLWCKWIGLNPKKGDSITEFKRQKQ